jgi:hypothetical protein
LRNDLADVIGTAVFVTSTWVERDVAVRQKAASKKFILPIYGVEK